MITTLVTFGQEISVATAVALSCATIARYSDRLAATLRHRKGSNHAHS